MEWLAYPKGFDPWARNGPGIQDRELCPVVLEALALLAAPDCDRIVGGSASTPGTASPRKTTSRPLEPLANTKNGGIFTFWSGALCRPAKHDCSRLFPRRGVSWRSKPGFLLSPKYVITPVYTSINRARRRRPCWSRGSRGAAHPNCRPRGSRHGCPRRGSACREPHPRLGEG